MLILFEHIWKDKGGGRSFGMCACTMAARGEGGFKMLDQWPRIKDNDWYDWQTLENLLFVSKSQVLPGHVPDLIAGRRFPNLTWLGLRCIWHCLFHKGDRLFQVRIKHGILQSSMLQYLGPKIGPTLSAFLPLGKLFRGSLHSKTKLASAAEGLVGFAWPFSIGTTQHLDCQGWSKWNRLRRLRLRSVWWVWHGVAVRQHTSRPM